MYTLEEIKSRITPIAKQYELKAVIFFITPVF